MLRTMKHFWLGALTCALFAVSSAAAHGEFTPIAGWDHQLFPSFVVATATIRTPDEDQDEEDAEEAESLLLGDRQGLLGVEIESPGDDVEVKVTITSDTILEASTFTGTLGAEGTTCRIYPRIKYKYAALTRNKQPVPVAVTFRVEAGDEEAEEQTATMTLRSVNDCPFAIVEGEQARDVSFVFAAYVNEQHPFVDKVLREALNGGVVDSFTGYQSGHQADVVRQVYALWHALSERDVRYSNITKSAAENNTVYSQYVRLIDESINNAQANCVDGSVLLASLLRKIDIEPMLVFIPGHCYLAFYLDAKQERLIALETTLIGSTCDDSDPQIPGLKDVVNDEWRTQNSWATFCSAVAMGCQDFEKNRARFNDKSNRNFQLISIAAARRLGILPIAFDSADKFQSATSSEE